MSVIDLKKYGGVLENNKDDSAVYFTPNGHVSYASRTIDDEGNFQKAEAMIQLMCELNAGIRSAEEKGWISEEDVRIHLKNRRNNKS